MSDPRIEAVVDALRSTPTQSYADGYRAGRDAAVAEVDKFMIQEEVTAGDVQRNKPFIAVARAIRALPVPEGEPAEAIELAAREKMRHVIVAMANTYVHEHFSYDGSTGAWETRSAAKESYEGGLRDAADAIAKLNCEKFGHDWQKWNDITRQCHRCEVQEHGEHLRATLRQS